MTEQTETTAEVKDPQIELLTQILETQKKSATRLGWLVFFGVMSFLGSLISILF